MELQAIRDKLQLLEAEPPAAETIALPWSAPKLAEAAPSSGISQSPASYPPSNRSPQAIAIEALKHRSGNTLINAQQNGPNAAASVADNLVAKALYKLEAQAHSINARSQQQAKDIVEMKRAARQAAFDLSQQGIHNHPFLAAITDLFDDTETADVPHIERDDQGYFLLSYEAVQIDSAQQSAIDTANTLRARSQSSLSQESLPQENYHLQNHSQKLFHEPIAASTSLLRTPAVEGDDEASSITRSGAVGRRIKASIRNVGAKVNKLKSKRRRSRSTLNKRSLSPAMPSRGYRFGNSSHSLDHTEESAEEHSIESTVEEYYIGGGVSWMDAAIWFSGGAIARIVAQFAVINYPWLAAPLLAGIIGTILVVIYRVVFSKSSDYSTAYRLFVAMLGLLSVGLF